MMHFFRSISSIQKNGRAHCNSCAIFGCGKSGGGGTAGGFTLIEMMIVLAIIAIILTLALPSYSDYMIRSKVAEALNLGAGAKSAVATTCVEDPTIASLNASNSGYAFNGGSAYVFSIGVSGPCLQPVISIETQNTGANPDPVITLTGDLTNGRIQFICTSNGQNAHVPKDCRT